jgi:HSP20 family protein
MAWPTGRKQCHALPVPDFRTRADSMRELASFLTSQEEYAMALTPLSRGSDFPALGRVRDELDRMVESLWNSRFGLENLSGTGQWLPRLDMSETDTAVVVNVDVPGIDPKQIDISVTGDTLTIRGERQEEKETKGKTFHRLERSYGSFCRSVGLPTSVDVDKIKATAKEGVLTITLPKREEVRPRQIKVETTSK